MNEAGHTHAQVRQPLAAHSSKHTLTSPLFSHRWINTQSLKWICAGTCIPSHRSQSSCCLRLEVRADQRGHSSHTGQVGCAQDDDLSACSMSQYFILSCAEQDTHFYCKWKKTASLLALPSAVMQVLGTKFEKHLCEFPHKGKGTIIYHMLYHVPHQKQHLSSCQRIFQSNGTPLSLL